MPKKEGEVVPQFCPKEHHAGIKGPQERKAAKKTQIEVQFRFSLPPLPWPQATWWIFVASQTQRLDQKEKNNVVFYHKKWKKVAEDRTNVNDVQIGYIKMKTQISLLFYGEIR